MAAGWLPVLVNILILINRSSADCTDEVIGGRIFETHIWEVGVGLLKAFQNGILTESPMFSIWNGTVEERWYLRLYPNGYLPVHKGQVSIYLVSQNDFETRPEIELIVLNKEPLDIIRKFSITTYVRFDQSNGWSDFATLSTLLDPSQGFIFDDKIRFGARFSSDPPPIREPGDHETLAFFWTVRLNTMDLPNEISKESPKFYSWADNGGLITWNLRLYPQNSGQSNDTGSDIKTSFYAVYHGETPHVVDVELFVKNKKRENYVRSWSHIEYTKNGESSGLKDFINRDLLINPENGFVNDGEIVFGLRVPNFNVFPVEHKEVSVTRTWDVGLESFQKNNTGLDEISMESPKYIVYNGNKKEGWHLRLFPNGYQDENNGFVSLYLVFDGNHTSEPFAEVFIVNKDPRNNLRKWSSETYDEPNESMGWHKFISKEYLLDPTNGFVIGNKIKFGVRLRTDPTLPDPGNYYHEVREWEVGLELLSALRNGGCTESPMFFITNGSVEQRWFIRLYPDGYLPMDKGSVSVYLVSQNDFETEPNIELSLLNKNPLKTVLSKSKPTYDHFESAGWDIFIQLSTLLDPTEGFMFDDKIKFMVEYTTDSTSISAPEGRETQAFLWALGLKTMNLPNGIGVESHQFQSWTPNGESTPLTCKIFPRGLSETDDTTSTMTSFFVRFLGRQPYTTVLELFVKNAKAENTLRLWMPVDFEQHGSYWGAVYFGRRELLVNPQNGFVDDDGTIVFGVRIPKFNEPLVEPEQYAISYTWDVGLELFNLKSTGFDEIALESPKFTVWNQQKNDVRFLRIYPDGYLDENNGFVSVQLVHDRNQTNAPLTKVFIVNKDPRNNLRRWSSDILYDNHVENMEWDRFITKEYLLDPSNGFVMDDKIKFGVQLRTDRVFPISGNPTFTNKWRIDIGSLLTSTSKIMSQNYEVKIHNTTETWYLEIYPNGKQFSDEGFVSLYLVSSNNSSIHPNAGIFLLNKKSENTIRKWYSELFNSPTTLGWDRLIKFSDLIDEKKGFVFGNETQFIEVGFTIAHETEDAKEVMPLKADPDPVIVPESLKIKLSTTVTTTVVTTPLPPVETTTLIPYQIEAVASNLL